MTCPYSSHYLIQLSFFSSHLALPLYKSRVRVAAYCISLFSYVTFLLILSYGVSFLLSHLLYSGSFSYHFSVVTFCHQPMFDFALSSLTIVIADHSQPRPRRKCPVGTRLMRGSDNRPNKCRSCHGCTIDNKCDTCSNWTGIVWAGPKPI